MSSSAPFVLAAKCTGAKSKELVIWAPTVVMRHLQCNRPNQIFGCASSDAISHIVTGELAEEKSPRWRSGVGGREVGVGRKSPSCLSVALCLASQLSLRLLRHLDEGQTHIKLTRNEVGFSFKQRRL